MSKRERSEERGRIYCFKGQRHYLGSYARFEDAVKARKRAEEKCFEPFLRGLAGKA